MNRIQISKFLPIFVFQKIGGNIVLVQAFLSGPFDQSALGTILESIPVHNQEPVRDWDKSIVGTNPKSGPVHNRDQFGNGKSQ